MHVYMYWYKKKKEASKRSNMELRLKISMMERHEYLWINLTSAFSSFSINFDDTNTTKNIKDTMAEQWINFSRVIIIQAIYVGNL